MVSRDKAFVDGLAVSFFVGGFFLLGQSRKPFQAFVKSFRHEAVVRIQKICVAGFDHTVNRSVAHSQAGLSPLIFKGEDALVVWADGREEREIILHILRRIERVFCQKKGELGLDSQGGREGLFIQFQTLSGQEIIQIRRQYGICKALVLTERSAVNAVQLFEQFFGFRDGFLAVLQGYRAQGTVVIRDSVGCRICQGIVQGQRRGSRLLAEEIIRQLIKI